MISAPDANANWERDAGERKATGWLVKTCVRSNRWLNVIRGEERLLCLTLRVSCWWVVTTGKDFESQTPLSTSRACATTLQSSLDSTSDRHIVWREMDTELDALSLRRKAKSYSNVHNVFESNKKIHNKTGLAVFKLVIFLLERIFPLPLFPSGFSFCNYNKRLKAQLPPSLQPFCLLLLACSFQFHNRQPEWNS